MSRRSFKRTIGKRRYKKMYVIASEGTQTEPIYFGMFNNNENTIHVKSLKGKHKSAPKHVLSRMKNYIRNEGLKKTDEAWLIVDSDQWPDPDLKILYDWSCSQGHYGLAVSNPKFEYWLLLHFEDGTGISTSSQCTRRLKSYLPNFGKSCIDEAKVKPGVQEAINRAILKDSPPCTDWPHTTGTTVYMLVKKLL